MNWVHGGRGSGSGAGLGVYGGPVTYYFDGSNGDNRY
jgi:hypothetical protein